MTGRSLIPSGFVLPGQGGWRCQFDEENEGKSAD